MGRVRDYVNECVEERSLALAHRRIMTSAGFRLAKLKMRVRNQSLESGAGLLAFRAASYRQGGDIPDVLRCAELAGGMRTTA
jgi:hypothetical protein